MAAIEVMQQEIELGQPAGMLDMNRIEDFERIVEETQIHPSFKTERALLIEGDSLKVCKSFPDHSVSLLLTDPPYHSTKKDNIYGDNSFKEDEQYLEWVDQYAVEWKRILKPNGSVFCFCSPTMAARLEMIFSKDFNILSHIVWTKPNDPGFDGWKQKMSKEALRQWYDHSERVIFAEPAISGNLRRSYCGHILRGHREKTGLSSKDVAEIIGAYGRVNHGGAVSNWEAGRNVPSLEQYMRLRAALINTGKIDEMPDYRDVVRPFNVDKTKEFTDIWTFPNIRPYKGKHPAEKPITMLEHAIAATTYQGDIVLDCFAGSGSTAVAALKLGRYSVSMEIEEYWCNKIKRLLTFIEDKSYQEFPDNYNPRSVMSDQYQDLLF
jgi:site-specific DNA-methyltransferase (adenine-specific)